HFNAGSSLATNRMAGCLLSPLTCSNQEPPGTAAKAQPRWDDNSPDRAKCQSSAKALRVFLHSGKWPDRSGGEEHCSQRRSDRSALVSGGDLDGSLHAAFVETEKRRSTNDHRLPRTRRIEQALPGLVDRGALSRVGRSAGLSEPSCRSARCRQWNLRRPGALPGLPAAY